MEPADPAPDGAQLVAGARREIGDGADAEAVQAFLHLLADARERAHLELEEALRQLVFLDHHQAVGLHEVRGRLGDEGVGPDADGGAQVLADGRLERLLHLPGERQGFFRVAPAPGELAIHLVDREHRPHRNDRVDGGDGLVVRLDVELVPRDHELDLGAQTPRLRHLGARLHPVLLGLDARRDAHGGVGEHRHHAQGLAAQPRLRLLLDGGEIGVEVDEEGAKHFRYARLRVPITTAAAS
jgi:hypothetical protein